MLFLKWTGRPLDQVTTQTRQARDLAMRHPTVWVQGTLPKLTSICPACQVLLIIARDFSIRIKGLLLAWDKGGQLEVTKSFRVQAPMMLWCLTNWTSHITLELQQVEATLILNCLGQGNTNKIIKRVDLLLICLQVVANCILIFQRKRNDFQAQEAIPQVLRVILLIKDSALYLDERCKSLSRCLGQWALVLITSLPQPHTQPLRHLVWENRSDFQNQRT